MLIGFPKSNSQKQVTQNEKAAMIQELDPAYNVHFDTKKGLLSPEIRIFFNITDCKQMLFVG